MSSSPFPSLRSSEDIAFVGDVRVDRGGIPSDRGRVGSDWWTPCLLSFFAGATSVSLIWCAQSWERRKRQRRSIRGCESSEEDDNDEDESGNDDDDDGDDDDTFESVSWIDPRNWNRIGELPRRSHWPWETIRRRRRSGHNRLSEETRELEGKVDDTINSHSDHDFPTAADQGDRHKKSGLCIGRIFGLDVGGTLTKLVYFEPKSTEYDPLSSQQHMFNRKPKARDDQQVPHRRHTLSFAEAQGVEGMGLARQHIQSKSMHEMASLEEISRHASFHNHSSAPADLVGMGGKKLNDELPEVGTQYQIQYHRSSSDPEDHDVVSYLPHDSLNASPNASSKMKKSLSMLDFSQSRDRAQVLNEFYSFARSLDMQKGEGGDRIHVDKDHHLSFYSRELGGDFHFLRFESRRMANAIRVIRDHKLHENIYDIGATGGGAHKYADDFDRYLGIRMDKQDELDSLVAGMQFVLSTVVGECYTFRPNDKQSNDVTEDGSEASAGKARPGADSIHGSNHDTECVSENAKAATEDGEENESMDTGIHKRKEGVDKWWWSRKVQRDAVTYSSTYPYLLVTIGTGVSILRVDGPRKHERISGSTIGGGTYWGLIRLLTDVEDFEDVMRLADHGDPSKVDMMVGDIYGQNSNALEKIGLSADVVASSFGKLVTQEDPAKGLKQEDLARALLLMVTNNIGQVAYLNAKLHKTPRIYFVGNFLRENRISQKRLSYAISYWSKGEMEALFLEHEGYFGALGAFLLSQKISHGDYGFLKWK